MRGSDNLGDSMVCRPALLIGAGEFGRQVIGRVVTAVAALPVAITRIVAPLQFDAVENDAEDVFRRELGASFNTVMDANTHDELETSGLLIRPGPSEITAIACFAGEAGDAGDGSSLFGALEVFSEWVREEEPSARLIVAVVATLPEGEASELEHAASSLCEKLQGCDWGSANVCARAFFVSHERDDGSRFDDNDLVLTAAEAMFVSVAPGWHSLLVDAAASLDHGHCALGISSLLVPFGEIVTSLRARLGMRLLNKSVVEAGDGQVGLDQLVTSPDWRHAMLAEDAIFEQLVHELPIDAKYGLPRPRIALRPEYSQPAHAQLSRSGPMKWAELLTNYEAELAHLRVRQWGQAIEFHGDEVLKAWRTKVEGVIDGLLRRLHPLTCVRALAEKIADQADQLLLADMETTAADTNLQPWRERLQDEVDQYPNVFALGARVLLLVVPVVYAFVYIGLRSELPEGLVMVAAAVAALLAGLGFVLMKLASHQRRLELAAEDYITAISNKHSAVLLMHIAAAMVCIRDGVLVTAQELTAAVERVEAETQSACGELGSIADRFQPPKSVVEKWVVDGSDLKEIYRAQNFNEELLGEHLVSSGIIADGWRDVQKSDIVERAQAFCDGHLDSLHMMAFSDFFVRRFGGLDEVGNNLRELYRNAIPAVPRRLLGEEPRVFKLVIPREDSIKQIAEREADGLNIASDDILVQDAFSLTVASMTPIRAGDA